MEGEREREREGEREREREREGEGEGVLSRLRRRAERGREFGAEETAEPAVAEIVEDDVSRYLVASGHRRA